MSADTRLKPGWRIYRFDEIAINVNERVDDPSKAGVEYYVGLEHLDADSLTIRRWGSPSDVQATKLLFKKGDIIFGRRRVYQRKVAVAPFHGICSAHAMVLRARPDAVLPEFLPFFMQTDAFMERAKAISVGSLSPTINWSALAREEFLLPPLDEQRRILVVLTAIDEVNEALTRAGETFVALATALFADLQTSSVSSQLLPVSELTTERPRNGFSPPPNSEGNGLRTVSISAIRANIFDPSGCIKHALVDLRTVRPFLVQAGDVFVVRGNGNRSLCGLAGLSEQSYDDLFYPDLLIRLRFDRSKLLPAFAVAQWNSMSVHRQLLTRAKSSNGIWKINGEDVSAHRLLVPPLPDQERFVRRVRDLQRQSLELAARRTALVDIRKILTRSFAA